MRRRSFLKKSAVLSLGALGAGGFLNAPQALAKKTYRWRLVMAVPKTLPIWGQEVVRFAKKVKALSGGQLNIKVYGSGELVPSSEVFQAVKSGKVEMGHGASYYWIGKIPAAAFFTAVPFGMTSSGMSSWLMEAGGLELWRKLYEPHNIMPFPSGITNTQMAGWFKKEIKTKKSLKGLKMRIPGLGGHVLSRMGVNTLLMSSGEIFTNLTTGVLDATEWVGPYHDYVMGFYKAAKHCYFPGWQEPSAQLELLVHKPHWQALPKELKDILVTANEELERRVRTLWFSKDAYYLEKLKKKGVQFKPLPKPILKELYQHSLEVVSSVGKTDALSQKIYDSYRKHQKLIGQYERTSNFAYNRELYLNIKRGKS